MKENLLKKNNYSKFIISILMFTMMLMLGGCKSNDENGVNLESVVKNTLKNNKSLHIDLVYKKGDDNYNKNFKYFFGGKPEDVADGIIAYDKSGNYADEITIFRANSSKDINNLINMLKVRKVSREKSFNGYVPKEAQKVKEARITKSGMYVILVIGDKSNNIEAQLMSELR